MANSFVTMLRALWWVVLLRGVLAIVFGILALVAPAAALTGIAVVYGVYALLDGISVITYAVEARSRETAWGWLLVQGVISVLAGLTVLVFPAFAGTVGGLIVLWTIVFYALMHGIAGVRSVWGHTAGGRLLRILGESLTIVLGVLLAILVFVVPDATVLSLVWVVGIYAIIFGVLLVATALQVRTTVHTGVQRTA
jgi:uncharacterized membrane protein HdeD (DUF308 family)